jgi:hypothetical protein
MPAASNKKIDRMGRTMPWILKATADPDGPVFLRSVRAHHLCTAA